MQEKFVCLLCIPYWMQAAIFILQFLGSYYCHQYLNQEPARFSSSTQILQQDWGTVLLKHKKPF